MRRCKEQAVSEAIGFIIIFGIMVTGIGLVTMYGYPVLQKEQQNAQIKNMERAFLVIQSDINSLVYKSIPYHETDIQVTGGTLVVVPSLLSSQNFHISGISNPLDKLPWDPTVTYRVFKPGEIRFNTSDQQYTASIENGGLLSVWWSSPGSAMISKPRLFLDERVNPTPPPNSFRTLVIPFIQINTPDGYTQSLADGVGHVQMKIEPLTLCSTCGSASANGPIYHEVFTTPTDIVITYQKSNENDYRTAWTNTLAEKFNLSPNPASPPGTTQFTVPSITEIIITGYNVTIISLH